jgi:hypothetical protein
VLSPSPTHAAAFLWRRDRRHRHRSQHISASRRPGTNNWPHSVHGLGSCTIRLATLYDAALSGLRSRHARTAALWHRRHHDDRPSRILEFAGNRSKGTVFPHLEHRFVPVSAITSDAAAA